MREFPVDESGPKMHLRRPSGPRLWIKGFKKEKELLVSEKEFISCSMEFGVMKSLATG